MDAETERLIREVWSDLSAGWRNGLASFETRMNARFDRLEARMDRMELRMDRVEARLTKLETQVATLESFVVKLDERVTKLDERGTKLEERLTKLEVDVAAFKQIVLENFARVQRNFELVLAEVRDPAHKARLDKIEERLARLEHHVGLSADD